MHFPYALMLYISLIEWLNASSKVKVFFITMGSFYDMDDSCMERPISSMQVPRLDLHDNISIFTIIVLYLKYGILILWLDAL